MRIVDDDVRTTYEIDGKKLSSSQLFLATITKVLEEKNPTMA